METCMLQETYMIKIRTKIKLYFIVLLACKQNMNSSVRTVQAVIF